MPYESYTNDSDAIFAQQLDSLKLSSTTVDPSYSSLGANVAVGNLGFDRELGLDMRSKMGMHQQGMATRQAISEDRSKAFEAGEFKNAMDEVKQSLTGDMVADASILQDLSFRYAGNKQVQDALNGMSATANRVGEAKRQAFINKKTETEESIYDPELVREATINEQHAILLESREKLARAQITEGMTKADIALRRSQFAGDVGAVDRDLGERAAVLIGMQEDLGLGDDVINMMTGMLGSVVESDGLNQSVAKGLGPHLGVIQAIEKAGINLSETDDKMAVDKYIAELKRNSPAGLTGDAESKLRQQAQISLAEYRQHEAIGQMKDEIVGKIKDVLPENPINMTEDDKKALKAEFLKLNNRMQQVNGHIRKINKDYSTSIETKKQIMDIQKEALSIKKIENDMDHKKATLKISQDLLRLREKQADDVAFMKYMSALPSDIQKDVIDGWLKEKELTLDSINEYPGGARQALIDFAQSNSLAEGGRDVFLMPENE